MSIQSEIERISANIAGAYTAVEEMGGTLPEEQVSGNLEAAVRSIPSAAPGGIPSGGIIIWSGASDAVPDGWAICDGENGTPDLRGRFVLGQSDGHAIGETGGSEDVILTEQQIPAHKHTQKITREGGKTVSWVASSIGSGLGGMYGLDPSAVQEKTGSQFTYLTTENAGGNKSHTNMPPYYVLAYIMKCEMNQ